MRARLDPGAGLALGAPHGSLCFVADGADSARVFACRVSVGAAPWPSPCAFERGVEVKALLKELRRMGKTILISSHILTELADCCTSIGIIERGQLLMHGPIDEVYRKIRGNRVVEIKFVDSMDVGLSIIRSCPQTRDVQIEDHQVTVEMAADDQQVAALLAQLTKSTAKIRSFYEKDPTLEDVFMLVTKGLVI